MGGYVIFQMWGPFRDHLIDSHEFYVREARQRLLDPLTDEALQADADRHADAWLARAGVRFDPDRHDPADDYERAHDERIHLYLRLDDLRKTVRLSIIAGFYHEWEKQLRDWVSREISRIAPGKHLRAAIWRVTISDLFDFLESWGWPVRSRPHFRALHLCHLVINVYKHGSGASLDELTRLAPTLTGHLPNRPAFTFSGLDHTNLCVDDHDLERFAGAISAFWQDVPKNTFQSQIVGEPAWVSKALEKDVAASKAKS